MMFHLLSRTALLVALGCSLVPLAPTLRAEGDETAEKKKAEKAEKKKAERATPADKDAESQIDADMAAWMAANQLGKEHEALRADVGTWDVQGMFWMTPGAPPVQADGVSRIRPLLGGRFIQETYKTEFMGEPFQGIGIVGYDTMKKVYVSVWMDSMSNIIMHQEGIPDEGADEPGKTVTYFGEHPKPDGTGVVKTKMVYRVDGKDKRKIMAYELQGDGGERKTMILNYTRRAKKDTAEKKAKAAKQKAAKQKAAKQKAAKSEK